MKHTVIILFATFLSSSVLAIAQQSDGHLPRATERTPDQQAAEQAKPAPPAAAAPAKAAEPAKTAESPKPAKQTAANTAPRAAQKPSAAAPASEPKLINGIPEDAVKAGPYLWSWTDSEGKEWLYQRTPFGVTRSLREEVNRNSAAVAASAGSAGPADWKAVEKGDEIEFERPSPFGSRKWTKKKDALSPDEQAVWDRLKKKD